MQAKASAPTESTPKPIELENIEDMRRREGIDDVDLRKRIRALAAGDHVNVTFLIGDKASETWQVRITSIRGSLFRGKLARRSGDQPRSTLSPGASVVFKPGHIHSLVRR